MPLTFYWVPHSTSNFTSAVLSELEHGLPEPLAQRIQLSIQAGDTKAPHYLSTINPNGRVPAIVHDGVSIWESAAITMYLGETFGVREANKSSLYPALGPKRGEAMKWIVWTNTTLVAAGSQLADALPAGTPGGTEEGSQDFVPDSQKSGAKAQEEKTRKRIAKELGILDGALEGKEYILGKDYSLVDTHVWAFMSWLTVMGVGMEGHVNVKNWMDRVKGRPALKDQ